MRTGVKDKGERRTLAALMLASLRLTLMWMSWGRKALNLLNVTIWLSLH